MGIAADCDGATEGGAGGPMLPAMMSFCAPAAATEKGLRRASLCALSAANEDAEDMLLLGTQLRVIEEEGEAKGCRVVCEEEGPW